MSVKKEKINIVIVDEEGVGRSRIGQALVQKQLPNISINGVGVRRPDSGRTTMHPLVVQTVSARCGADISNEPVTLLTPEMVTAETIVLVLNDHKNLPGWVTQQALAVLLAPIADPFPKLENELENAASRISFHAWLLMYVLTNKFEELDTKKDSSGNVKPRYLVEFEPRTIEPEYSYDNFHAAIR